MTRTQSALTSPYSPIYHPRCSVCPAKKCRIPRHISPPQPHGEVLPCSPLGACLLVRQTRPAVFLVLLFPIVRHEVVGCITSLQGGPKLCQMLRELAQTQPFLGQRRSPKFLLLEKQHVWSGIKLMSCWMQSISPLLFCHLPSSILPSCFQLQTHLAASLSQWALQFTTCFGHYPVPMGRHVLCFSFYRRGTCSSEM